ncbi:DUF5131 family protein [Rhodoplanes roseus]|uniref:Phage Gp37/Gp68 family protein n=1 Tax=Rhodoplanes roseus TaxID=29409 RepID=A0A327L3X8_9BRAD|nr:DUF5131 family protein [Rhodoplanes roseus]RAI45271.1 hypothetical protein CH341_04985 [Rhodoplanes roseus]
MSTISWLRDETGRPGRTWNPIRARHRATGKIGWHCEPVHEGCKHCYAAAQNRAGARGGTGLPYKPGHRDDVELFLDEKTLRAPLHWRKPLRIFACSMTDLYGSWVPDEWIDRIKAVQALTPQHTYIELTKRPERMGRYLSALRSDPGRRPYVRRPGWKAPDSRDGDAVLLLQEGQDWPLPNVWAGPSCSTQDDANRMIPEVLQTPLAKRLVSFEPLLNYIDLAEIDCGGGVRWDVRGGRGRSGGLDLAIVGGLNGPEPTDIDIVRDLVRQCRTSAMPVFVKQLGRTCRMTRAEAVSAIAAGAKWRRHKSVDVVAFKDRKGEDPAEWPSDLRVREWPEVRP